MVPPSVTSIDEVAFNLAADLATVTFLGDAPSFGFAAFGSTGIGPAFYKSGASGWGHVSDPLDGHPLTAVDAPDITDQPDNATVANGQAITLRVAADAHTGGGTATNGVNYSTVVTNVLFPPGEVLETVIVPVIDDLKITDDLTVNLELSNPTATTTVTNQTSAVLTIWHRDIVVFRDTFVEKSARFPPQERVRRAQARIDDVLRTFAATLRLAEIEAGLVDVFQACARYAHFIHRQIGFGSNLQFVLANIALPTARKPSHCVSC